MDPSRSTASLEAVVGEGRDAGAVGHRLLLMVVMVFEIGMMITITAHHWRSKGQVVVAGSGGAVVEQVAVVVV